MEIRSVEARAKGRASASATSAKSCQTEAPDLPAYTSRSVVAHNTPGGSSVPREFACCSCGLPISGFSDREVCEVCRHTLCRRCRERQLLLHLGKSSRPKSENSLRWEPWPVTTSMPNRVPSRKSYRLNPKAYSAEVRSLKERAYLMSPIIQDLMEGVESHFLIPTQGLSSIACQMQCSNLLDCGKLFRYCECDEELPSLFQEMLDVRNRLVQVCQTVLYLKAAGLVRDRISVVVKRHPKASIAELLTLHIQRIFELLQFSTNTPNAGARYWSLKQFSTEQLALAKACSTRLDASTLTSS